MKEKITNTSIKKLKTMTLSAKISQFYKKNGSGIQTKRTK